MYNVVMAMRLANRYGTIILYSSTANPRFLKIIDAHVSTGIVNVIETYSTWFEKRISIREGTPISPISPGSPTVPVVAISEELTWSYHHGEEDVFQITMSRYNGYWGYEIPQKTPILLPLREGFITKILITCSI